MNRRFGYTTGDAAVRKRGGNGAPDTSLDPTQYPTAPPQSTYKHGVPTVGGSEGGFIGLVVGLGVLIIICCGVVYYLLRTRKHGGRANNKNFPPDASSSGGRSRGFFSSLPFRGTSKQNAGWIQQSDEFNYESDDEDLVGRKDPQKDFGYAAASSTGELAYGDGGTGYTGQSGHLMQRGAAKSPAADEYTDPFDPTRLPESVRKQQAPLPASTSASSAPTPHKNSVDTDDTVKHSPTSPTFEGGTKFREQF